MFCTCSFAVTGGREVGFGQLPAALLQFCPISAVRAAPQTASGLIPWDSHGQGVGSPWGGLPAPSPQQAASEAPTKACASHRRFPVALVGCSSCGLGVGRDVHPGQPPAPHPAAAPQLSAAGWQQRGLTGRYVWLRALLMKTGFSKHFVGIALIFQCLNTLQKPAKLRWFLLGREGGSCCRSLTYACTHTHTGFFSSFPLSSSKGLQTLYKNVIFSQTVAFLPCSPQAAYWLSLGSAPEAQG